MINSPVFFSGIGGSGMLPLACIVRANGGRVAGSDRSLDAGRTPQKFDYLRSLGIQPHSTRDFVLADGQVVHRRLATATFEYEGRRGDSMCIVGEPGDDPLLGATTLEGFGLVLDPFRRELRPMPLHL